jgi:hypothetical protein
MPHQLHDAGGEGNFAVAGRRAGQVHQLQEVKATGHAHWVAAAQARKELVAQQQQLQRARQALAAEQQQLRQEKEAFPWEQQQLEQLRQEMGPQRKRRQL